MNHGTNTAYTVHGCRCEECKAAHAEAARRLRAEKRRHREQAISDEFNTLRGRILGLIESWGLPERQESGCKAIFKTLTYDAEKHVKEIE